MAENQDKPIAEVPEGMEYIWAIDPALTVPHSPENGFIELSKKGADYYELFELKLKRTERLHTYEGRRCIFVDMPVFEVEQKAPQRLIEKVKGVSGE